MRFVTSMTVLLLLSGLGCRATGTPVVSQPRANPDDPGAAAEAKSSDSENKPVLTAPDKIPAERQVWAYIKGQRRLMDIDEARSYGLTIVDLSDDWVPYIFWDQTPGKDDRAVNTYQETYVALANDRIDVDGVALEAHERNYMEAFGIPPSLTVLRQRFVSDEEKACFKELDYETFKQYYGSIRIVDPAGSKHNDKLFFNARGAYKKALREARVKTLDELLKIPEQRAVAEKYRKYKWRHDALRAMQKRMVCEGMFGKRAPTLKPGVVTWALRNALRRFERKHNVYGWGMMFEDTAAALGRTPRENNYESLKRVLTERVVSATGVLEDGTRGKATYKNRAGQKVKVRNMVQEMTLAMVQELGLTDADKAYAFITAHKSRAYKRFHVAVKLPPLPEYYSDNMDLEMIIDRGDVWYDFPNKFNAAGKIIRQGRSRYPSQTLYVKWQEQKIPLVRWRTTIGGWQPEMRNGFEYYKYKVSDIGPRVWKNIVAGPVWVPPHNTPPDDMVKRREVRGRSQRIVGHHTFGPGYASAYGLVAAFHVTKAGHDNQVRTHGTVNYMSINSSQGFSHGCHRLYNFRAVRLFSFVLRHRPFIRKGQSKLAYQHRFEFQGEEFQLDLRTRGYYYEMTPPVPVNVLEGNIRGTLQQPIEEYLKKPTKMYQDDQPTMKSKTPSGAPRIKKKKKKGGMMNQEQIL